MARLIEREAVKRDYGMRGTKAIVETDDGRRVLIDDGFGGMDSPRGGAVRWRHGLARACSQTDTLESLAALSADELDDRVLLWGGDVIARIAESVGL